MTVTTIQVYTYTERDAKGHPFKTSYSIRKGAKPLGFRDEKLTDEFDIVRYADSERDSIEGNRLESIIEFDSRQ